MLSGIGPKKHLLREMGIFRVVEFYPSAEIFNDHVVDHLHLIFKNRNVTPPYIYIYILDIVYKYLM